MVWSIGARCTIQYNDSIQYVGMHWLSDVYLVMVVYVLLLLQHYQVYTGSILDAVVRNFYISLPQPESPRQFIQFLFINITFSN